MKNMYMQLLMTDNSKVIEFLDKQYANGWEFISSDNGIYIFKRREATND